MKSQRQARAKAAAFPWNVAFSVLLLGAALALSTAARGRTVLPPPAHDAPAAARPGHIDRTHHQLTQATNQKTAKNEEWQHQLRDARPEIPRLQGIVSDLTAANNGNGLQNPPAQGGASFAPAPNTAPNTPAGAGLRSSSSGLNSAQVAATG